MKTWYVLWCGLGIFFSAKLNITATEFTKTTQEKQVEWVFYADDFSDLDYSKKYARNGVAYYPTKQFAKDIQNYNYGEESKHVEFVRLCENLSSFHESLRQVSIFDGMHNPYTFWKPRFFVVWPGVEESAENAKSLFLDQIMGAYVQNLTVESNVYVVIPFQEKINNTVTLSLWESYTINKNEIVYHELLPLDWYNEINKMGRRGNLHGTVIRVMSVDDPHYHLETKFNGTKEQPEFESGIQVELIWFMRDRLNFTISAVKGNWTTELIGKAVEGGALEIENDIADLCISQTPTSPRRAEHIHFLQPNYVDGLRAYFVQPSAGHYRDMYYTSFEKTVWISFLCIWILIFMSMNGFYWIKKRYSEVEVLDQEITNESLLWIFGAACQQGWYQVPSSLSIRLVFLAGYLTGFVCFVAFSASIVSTLSVKSNPMSSFEKVVNAGFQMYVQDDSSSIIYLKDFLKTQKDSSYAVNASSALWNIGNTKSALITYPESFHILTSCFSPNIFCEMFASVPATKGPVQTAMMVKKGSPFTEFFNLQITLMRERGINYRFFQIFLKATRHNCLLNLVKNYTRSLEFIDVQSAFIILASGYFLSLVFLGIEINL